jgi:hypothetical protein
MLLVSPKRHKLSVAIDEDYCLLGIASDEPDYKLCWLINQQMNTSLAKVDDLLVFNSKLNEQQEVALFVYYDENKMVTYRLIGNRLSTGYFLSDLKNIDYVLHIQGDIVESEIDDFIRRLVKAPGVRLCVPVDLQKIRERDRLHLW